MIDELLTTLEVARLLGVGEWRIRYLLRCGRVRPPTKVASGNYLWQPAEIRDLARALDVPIPESMAQGESPPCGGASAQSGPERAGSEPYRVRQTDGA